MQIKHLVFDMGNVLIQYNAQYYLEKYVPDEADRVLLMREVFQSVEWVRMDHGTITEAQAVAASCTRLPARLHDTAALLYRTWNQDIPPVPGMESLIARLKAAGYSIYLLSNTSVRYHEFRKPDPAIFRTFCQHFGLVPAQCLFVDDLPANVYGAQCAGMEGVVFYSDAEDLEQRLARYGVKTAKKGVET